MAMMRKRYGRIINITSPCGEFGFRRSSNYAASKEGQVALTRSLKAKEVATRGITVNCVYDPGLVLNGKWMAICRRNLREKYVGRANPRKNSARRGRANACLIFGSFAIKEVRVRRAVNGDGQYARRSCDDGYSIATVAPTTVVGSRMMTTVRRVKGWMPVYKFRFFFRQRHAHHDPDRLSGRTSLEFHSGIGLFGRCAEANPFELNSNGLPLRTEIIIPDAQRGKRIVELPIQTDKTAATSAGERDEVCEEVLRATVRNVAHSSGCLPRSSSRWQTGGTPYD